MLDEILYETDWRLGPHIFQKYPPPPGGDGISMGIVQIRLAIRIILAAGEKLEGWGKYKGKKNKSVLHAAIFLLIC